eukprot:m.81203 g.81203  ORF g.81203 m.81203 type:complete len:176 (+) comp8071_c0_seq3:31-558(+)
MDGAMDLGNRKRAHEDGDDDMEQADMVFSGGQYDSFGSAPMATEGVEGASQSSAGLSAAAAAAASADMTAIPTDLLSEDLRQLLESMDEFVPTIPDAVTEFYLRKTGFQTSDTRVLRMISLATQKFIADIAHDAFQHSKQHRKTAKDKDLVLTTADLQAALKEHGINAVRPPYYS